MIPRAAAPTLERLARGFPLVALTGPRQSGKTTLAKSVFSGKAYVSLENPDEREFALQDPKRFLQRFPDYQLTQAPVRGGRARFRGFLSAAFRTA